MTNEIIFKKLIDNYNELSYTHNYMFGFIDNNTVYCAIATSEILPYVCKLDKASRGCGFSLRFSPNKQQKELLKTCQVFTICSKDFFNTEIENSKYNRGEIFEKLVTEYFGQVWTKDNIPFTKSGDLVIGKIHYQLKFEKATFINEKGLANFLKR